MFQLPWLDTNSLQFPDTRQALQQPNGLLAAGGDLSPTRLIHAYRQGIFPWFNEDEQQTILWWTPDPRTILKPNAIHIGNSLKKLLRKQRYQCTANQQFAAVVRACQQPRAQQQGTWIGESMFDAYSQLHQLGFAHSVEVWCEQQLVGGLYGIALGKVFFGESMFSRHPSASQCALVFLCATLAAHHFSMIDCQVESAYLLQMGATSISRHNFEQQLNQSITHLQPQKGLFEPDFTCLKK